MTRGVAVVRPEPGNRRTADALRALDLDVLALPLFATRATAWEPPDPARFDALLLTSAAAVRLGGAGLAGLGALPAVAVGAATAAAARESGLTVVLTGDDGVEAVVRRARAGGYARLLHLAGRDRVEAASVTAITVYANEALPAPSDLASRLAGRVVLLHSARIAQAVAAEADRARTGIASLADPVRRAAGEGWALAATAAQPTDAALIELAHRLAIDPRPWPADKGA